MAAEIVLLIVLFICMLFDLRTCEVPALLTLASLLGAAVFAICQGIWSPVLLVAALTVIADCELRQKRLAFSSVVTAFACIFQPASGLLCLSIYAVWLLWDFGMMGGADVKLLISVLLVFGDAAALLPVAIAGGVLGILAGLHKQRQFPYVPAIFSGTALFWVSQFI